MDFELPGWAPQEERSQHASIYPKLRALLANGLAGVDLTRCWVSWRILPLSLRNNLMYAYSGDLDDAQRYNNYSLDADEINRIVKKLLGENQETCSKDRLKPFYVLNPAPPVQNL